jgi:hypothetical protein
VTAAATAATAVYLVAVAVAAVLAATLEMAATVPLIPAVVVLRVVAVVVVAVLVTLREGAVELVFLVKAQTVALVVVVVLAALILAAALSQRQVIPATLAAAAVLAAVLVKGLVKALFGLFGLATFAHSHQQIHRICKWNFIFVLPMVNPLITQFWATIFAKHFQTLIHQTCLQNLRRLNVFSQRHKSMKLLLA